MANTKISALTSATTPLAGTEVLPIVQSSVTVKVATDDLTVRNVRANATTGILQVTGPAAASTRVMTVPNANFTAARTDAAQSFTGDQTLSTGNLVIGTSGKGIDFSATPGTGTSELLADYEEGTWTPTDNSGASLSFTGLTNNCFYTKVGNLVTCIFNVTYPTTADVNNVYIAGLPFTPKSTANGVAGGQFSYTNYGAFLSILVNSGTTNFYFWTSAGALVTNATASGKIFRGVITYMV